MASSWFQHDIDLPFFEKRNSSGSTNNVCSRHLNFHRIIFFFSFLKSKEGTRYLLFRTKNGDFTKKDTYLPLHFVGI